jgi:CRISPR system Cascade subunit CasE
MYLSRLILNPRSRRVQKEVANLYEMHRSIMRAFPEDLDAGTERVLFRLGNSPTSGGLGLLVQSLTSPNWSWLAEAGARGYLLPTDEPSPWVKHFDLNLAPSQVLAFRLRANPTVRRKGKRLGLYRWEDQLQWLTRKAEQGGFRLLSARSSSQRILGGQVHRKGESHRLRLLSVQFDGLLQVTDPARLHESVKEGVGSAKGLGFGLLSLAPPPS